MQASLSRSVIGSASSPGGGSKQIADSVRMIKLVRLGGCARRSPIPVANAG